MQKNILLDFQPTLIQSLKTCNKEKFVADLMAGLIVGVIALPLAIAVGLLLAVFAFLKRMNESTQISHTTGSIDISKELESHSQDMKEEVLFLPHGVEVYEIDGPFFFGVANKFDEKMREIGDHPNIRIIRMRKVPFIDSTGLNNLETLCRNSKKEKIQVILSGVKENIRESLYKSKIPGIVGEDNICADIHMAVERAKQIDDRLKKEHTQS